MAQSRPEMTGEDLRESMRMAAGDMKFVQDDMKRIAKESRVQVLQGDERKEFFRSMTQDEFELLHQLAFSMGPNGRTAMERLMNEAQEIYKNG